MKEVLKDRTNAQYTATLTYDTGAPVAKADVTSFKLTLFCLDDDAYTSIRNAQEQAPGFSGDLTMHNTSGLVTFNMTSADNAIVSTSAVPKRYERHRIIFDVTANSKRIVIQDEFQVENAEKVST